jgi:hypothetical protein
MKKLFILGAFILLSTILFSCTSDDYQDAQKEINPATPSYADGPGDLPIIVPPPPVTK